MGPRLGAYTPKNPNLAGLETIDSGSTFILPSHEDHVKSSGEATEKVLAKLSLHFAENFRFNQLFLKLFREEKANYVSQKYNISIHRRATDHMMHTNILNSKEFIKKIEHRIRGEDNIYIATDDKGFPELVKEQNPNINIITQKSERSNGSIGIHYLEGSSEDKIRRGSEILHDILMLSRSSILLCGASGIPFFSRVINPSLKLINVVDQPWF